MYRKRGTTAGPWQRQRFLLFTSLLLVALLAACAPSTTGPSGPRATLPPTVSPTVAPALQDTDWILAQLRGEDLVAGSYIQLSFEAKGFHGFAGCNHYGGEYETGDEAVLKFGQMEITLVDCPTPPGVVEQEQAYVEALREACTYRLEGDRLEIQDAVGETILTFVRQERVEADPAELLGATWQLVSLDGQDPIEGASFTLVFHDESQVSGDAGCRNYIATYEASGSDLHFLSMSMLGPVCPDGPLLEQEGVYTTILGWTDHFLLKEGQLELLTDRGERLIFEPLPSDAQVGLEGPTWKLLAFVEPNPDDESPFPLLTIDLLEGTEITTLFAEGTVRGSAGCNDYSGAYVQAGNSVSVSDLVATNRCEPSLWTTTALPHRR